MANALTLWGLREPGWYRDIVWLTSAPPNCYWWVSSGDPRWLHKWSPGSNQTNISIVMVRALTNRYKLSNNKFLWVLKDCMVRSWSEDIILNDSDKIFGWKIYSVNVKCMKIGKNFQQNYFAKLSEADHFVRKWCLFCTGPVLNTCNQMQSIGYRT